MVPSVGLEREDIERIVWAVVDEFLIPKFNELGMYASGEWVSSLEVRVNIDNDKARGEIWGKDYTKYLVNGRAGGSKPPISALESWVNNKFGLFGNEARSMAFAVASKIEKEGTSYYPQGTDLLEVLESDEVLEFIREQAKGEYVKKVKAEILRNFRS